MHATLLKGESAQAYACGFSCDNGLLLQTPAQAFFITDGRYVTDAKAKVTASTEVIDGGRELVATARKIVRRLGITSLALDPLEWNISAYETLLKGLHVRVKPKSNLSQKSRIIKAPQELLLLQSAVQKGAEAFDAFVAFVREYGVGLSEKTLHYEASRILTCKGALGLSFSPIVAINANAAKPHATPQETVLAAGDLLLLDAGIIAQGYCSDRTRTFEVGPHATAGKTQTFTCKTRQKVYDTVLKAQEAAIALARPGVRACAVDKAAREVIDAAGYGAYFVHSTGHGVGLDIHELPVISASSQSVLEEGMVFTVEPGIYLPGEFGVRIEDMVVVQASGVEVL
ncbi:M24 family metallopeptidase [Sulfurospirillum sp. T05]|uniref:M24 family metallopeptidase n=1 Tax=Sulfurospirillum tamanense TaxID=2813362 RepID=A0ABS2WP58_9BACT|nr:M24 family metallopeptidase [Sulfurospirillum tamanensis]MBN2963466.1 M24 family metallopeptidase [Sulfurospirillum tamanensis]